MSNKPQPQSTGSSDDELRRLVMLILSRATVEPNNYYGFNFDLPDNAFDELFTFIKADRQKVEQRANRTLRLAALKHKGEMAKAVTAARIEENVTYRDWYGTMNDEAVRELATSRINQLEGSLTNQEVA